MRPEFKIPLREILVIVAFILGLIVRGLDIADAIKKTADLFDLPIDIIRTILGIKD